MNDTPRTQELRDDLAGIASEAPIWKLFKKLDCRQLERELTAVTEQRDELLRYNEAFRKETLICADCDAIRKEEYDQAIEQRDKAWQKIENQAERITYLEGATNHATGTPLSKAIKQRDRLAEALQKLADCDWVITPRDRMDAVRTIAREALQSLTTKEL